MTPSPLIRAITPQDRTAWDGLWQGYLSFYEVHLAADITDATFARVSQGNGINGFIALSPEGAPLGLVHYTFHPSTWSKGGYCYLEDLFVKPEARGLRLGRALITATETAARDYGATRLYWNTEEFNGTARRLYERLAKRAPFVRYQIAL